MKLTRVVTVSGLLQGVALATLVSVPLAGLDQLTVRRGTLARQGRAWVERAECSAPVREGGRLVLRADFGSIVIKPGAERDRLQCEVVLRAFNSNEAEARRSFARYELSGRNIEGGGVYLIGRSHGELWRSMSVGAEFDVHLPQRFNLDIQTQGGDITLESPVQGEVRATTAAGEIRTTDVSGPVRVETASGSISLGNVGRHLEARTAGGGIRVGAVTGDAALETSGGEIVTGGINGTVRAETAGGDVDIANATGAVTAETAGGQIRIGPAGGSVRAQTAGGSIRLQGARGRVVVETAGGSIDLYGCQGAVKASTAAGRILAQINADRKSFGASQLDTSMGDIQVFLPPDLPLTIDAAIERAAGHRIVSDFPLLIQGEAQEFVQREIRGRGALNGGGQVLRIRTMNGNIEIRKLDLRVREQLREREEDETKSDRQRSASREQREKEPRKTHIVK